MVATGLIAIVVVALLVGVTISRGGVLGSSQGGAAGQDRHAPHDVGAGRPMTTDLADGSFAVVLTTTVAASGTVIYGTTPTALTQTAYDDRDATSAGLPRHFVLSTGHRFTVSKLARHTAYYYEPVLDGIAHGDGTGHPFRATTADVDLGTLPPLPAVVYGQIHVSPVGASPQTLLIVLNVTQTNGAMQAAPQSVLVTDTVGSGVARYTFPSGSPPLLTSSGDGYYVSGQPTTFSITAFGAQGIKGSVSAKVGSATGIIAEPLMVLSSTGKTNATPLTPVGGASMMPLAEAAPMVRERIRGGAGTSTAASTTKTGARAAVNVAFAPSPPGAGAVHQSNGDG